MEKLLHERMREWVKIAQEREDPNFPFWYARNLTDCGNPFSKEGEADILNAFADEIERYYIPRPRFEDGEPVQFRDELSNGERVGAITYHMHGACRINESIIGTRTFEVSSSEPLKRPTPKALDADGVEIKVGQKRWSVESDNEYDILEIKPDGSLVKCGCPNKGGEDLFVWLAPEQLTYEQPVFDADGKRIKAGDTVWATDPETLENATVVSIEPDKLYSVYIRWSDGITDYVMPKHITHHEPDCLEKLLDFVTPWAHSDNIGNSSPGDYCDAMAEIKDRLTALIERGA